LHRAQNTLVQKEEELAHVKRLYCAAVKEKQKLAYEAEVCRRKMGAASTLINGLSGEKLRWTMQSKAFKEQLVRLVVHFSVARFTYTWRIGSTKLHICSSINIQYAIYNKGNLKLN